jgi:urea transporter
MKTNPANQAQESRTSGWARVVGRHPLLEYLDSVLRGCGQVIFMNNPLTGVLNLLAMFWGAYAGGTTYAVAVGSAAGALVSTAAAYALRVDRGALRMGLYGFNGMLVGAGIAAFLGNTPLMWAVLVFASASSTVVSLAFENLLRPWKMPGLTFPFVLTTWLVLLAAYKFSGLQTYGLPVATLVSDVSATGGPFGIAGFIRASLASISQVFFVDNPVSGAIFLLALAVHSRWCAGFAAFGSVGAVAGALLVGAGTAAISHGLWGYSAVLTAPALGCVFTQVSPSTLIYCAAATLFTVFVQGATSTIAQTVGIPALTFPFVLVTWLFLLARPNFEPKTAEQSPCGD